LTELRRDLLVALAVEWTSFECDVGIDAFDGDCGGEHVAEAEREYVVLKS
jgi:hypothetical protein